MLAIYKRELKSYFCNVTGCLFIAINLLFSGIYFTAYHLSYGYPYIAYTISSVLFILLIATPILTMKSLSDEKSKRTDQLLFTSPVSVIGIILGKYLAMVTVFLVPVMIMCAYPLFLGYFGKVAYAESYVAILGYLLFGSLCIAIGLLISSLTENVIIAAIGTFAVLMLTYLLKGICSVLSPDGNYFTKALSDFDTLSRMNDMIEGTIDFSAIVYFLSMICLVLFMTYRVLQKRRYTLNKSTMKMSLLSTSSMILFAGIVFLINYGIKQLPSEYLRLDVTYEGIYEITDTTKELLSSLDEDINIYVCAAESSADDTVAETLNRYEDISGHIKISYIDTYSNPDFMKKYGADSASAGSIIVEGEKRYKVIDYNDLYLTEFNYETYSNDQKGYDAEGQISSAIAYVLSDDMPKVYVISGHDEANLSSNVTSLIAKGNAEIQEINLMNYDAIPDDADSIIIVSPTIDYSADDAKKITSYIDDGGDAVIISSYSDTKLKNFDGIIEKYGVEILDGMVIEEDKDSFYQNPYFLLPKLASDVATEDALANKQYILMPYARPLSFPEDGEGEWGYSKILYTSDSSFAKKNVANADTYDKEAADEDGPFSVGIKLLNENTGACVYYFSSESLLNENVDGMVSYANSNMVVKALLSLIDNDLNPMVTIPAKTYELSNITISSGAFALMSTIVIAFLPFAFFIAGILVWVNRRKR